MKNPDRLGRPESAHRPATVAQATLRLRSEPECERVIGLAHRRGIASTMAYRGPEDGRSPIFVLVIDEVGVLEPFLPELQEAVPEARISVIREEVAHVSPPDFLRGGALRRRPFRVEMGQLLGWVFAGGALGAGARILTESGARYISPIHETFPWGTLAVNVSGSFAIAIFGTLIAERFIGERERMFRVLGFLGSFTTFSTLMLETLNLSLAKEHDRALFNVLGSVALGVPALFAGIYLGALA